MPTVVVTQAYQDMCISRSRGMADDDALTEVIKAVHERLFGKHDEVPSPVDSREDLSRISDEA